MKRVQDAGETKESKETKGTKDYTERDARSFESR
jgi:hypothetical protein